jgi:DnaJ family protein C protein 13
MLMFYFIGVEIQCIGHFKLLFSLLRLDDCAKLQQFALEVSLLPI